MPCRAPVAQSEFIMASRRFRTETSLNAELQTRAAVTPMLLRHGFENVDEKRVTHGTAITQIIDAEGSSTGPIRAQVRLCWRRDGRKARENDYSAAQLRAKLIEDDWELTLQSLAERAAASGVTHSLFVQDSVGGIQFAALVPSAAIPEIWQRQRLVSAELIARGRVGRLTKNHAENGSSPTMWLQDDRWPAAHAVPDVLWNWPGVVNVLALPSTESQQTSDSVDDLPFQQEGLGRDEGQRQTSARSGYPRDAKVRTAVLVRAKGRCEREGCGQQRSYVGFLDVHHILGVGVSDRPWTCVALCPNCHREAHFSPDRDIINERLALYAHRFVT